MQFFLLCITLRFPIYIYIAANLHMILISEGSCDTEYRSNDAENEALPSFLNIRLQYITTENSQYKLQ